MMSESAEIKKQGMSQLLNSEMSEFISRKPDWIIRLSSLIFISILVLAIAGGIMIKYQDVISVPTTFIAGENGYYSKVIIPAGNAGEVKIGQRVKVKCLSCSDPVLDISDGEIISIKIDKVDGTCAVGIQLNSQRLLSDSNGLQQSGYMFANADIMVGKLSLLKRVWRSIVK